MLQTLYYTLFQPSVFQSRASFAAPWWQGALVILCVTTLSVFAMASGWNGQQLGLGLVLAWGQALLSWWFFSLLFHFASDIFGGKGRIQHVLAATGFASAPLIFYPLLKVFAQQAGKPGQTLAVIGAMVLVFWALTLLSHLLALSESFSLDKALGALVMTLFLVGALLFSGVVLGGLQIAFWGASLL